MKQFLIILIIMSVSLILSGAKISPEKMLRSFTEDFTSDPVCKERAFTFGIKIQDSGEWHIIIDGEGGVFLKNGMPKEPSVYFLTDSKTLALIYNRKMTALTAMGRAKYSDKTPMNFGFMKGFVPDPDFMGWGARFVFHFWTRGTPEIVDFGESTLSRFIHGAQAKIFYYEKGLRTSWYGIKKGQHINKDPGDQANPFPTLIIMIEGEADARIDGKEVQLKKGMSLHIPTGVSHEFWNNRSEVAEFIIIMFGKGA